MPILVAVLCEDLSQCDCPCINTGSAEVPGRCLASMGACLLALGKVVRTSRRGAYADVRHYSGALW